MGRIIRIFTRLMQKIQCAKLLIQCLCCVKNENRQTKQWKMTTLTQFVWLVQVYIPSLSVPRARRPIQYKYRYIHTYFLYTIKTCVNEIFCHRRSSLSEFPSFVGRIVPVWLQIADTHTHRTQSQQEDTLCGTVTDRSLINDQRSNRWINGLTLLSLSRPGSVLCGRGELRREAFLAGRMAAEINFPLRSKYAIHFWRDRPPLRSGDIPMGPVSLCVGSSVTSFQSPILVVFSVLSRD